jgi:phosphoglycolate phosphatase
VSLARPRALLFDWDNTLVDTWGVIHHALTVTFEAMDLEPWTLEQARRRVRQSARDAFPRLFGARAEEAAEIFYGTFERVHLEKLKEAPGARVMLEQLARAGDFYLAVVSNKRGDLLRREARHLGWDGYFAGLVGATDAPRDKPAPDAVALALEGSEVEPGPGVWFVGDTDIDMLCAANSGCLPVLVRDAAPGADEFGDTAPAAHFPDCAALAERVLSL